MSEYQAQKWVSAGKDRALMVHNVQNVFGPVASNPCSLISIFGRARQGKSFLMNCLAGEREIFKISNEKDSCTQGIDISNKWLNLADFSKIDGGKVVGGRTEGIKVGFVDAEGQGDKDVSYDANLICPILLTSKCVIFNWKGDLQKDHILSTLGIMARAAQNVAAENTASSSKGTPDQSKPKFGHLHVIFRDWQAVHTDENAVHAALFSIENTAEATTRDLIRKDLLSSFESIRVWLFEAPSEFTKDLKQKLTFEKTSAAFRAHVRELRQVLSQQLREPTLIAGNVLSGRAFGPLTEQIASALNTGQVVLPSSAYLSMMRQEALQLVHQYDAELRTQAQQLLSSINQPFPVSASSSKRTIDDVPVSLYLTHAEADRRLQALMKALAATFQGKIADVTGNVNPLPGSIVATILSEYSNQVKATNDAVASQFSAQYSQVFSQWLLRVRKDAERRMQLQAGALEKLLPLSDANPTSSMSLTQHLEAMRASAVSLIGGVEYYGESCAEVADAEGILQRLFEGLAGQVRAKNVEILGESQRKIDQLVREAVAQMKSSLAGAVAEMNKTRPTGYAMSELENVLNGKYHELKSPLEQKLRAYPDGPAAIDRFFAQCATLRTTMVEEYGHTRSSALTRAARQGREVTVMQLAKANIEELWKDTPLDECEAKLLAFLDHLSTNAQLTTKRNCVGQWLLENSNSQYSNEEIAMLEDQEARFSDELQEAVDEAIGEFKSRWLQELTKRMEQQAETACTESEDEEEDEEEEEEDEASNAVQGISISGKKATGTAAEQRKRAAEWAAKELGLNDGGKVSKKRGKKIASAKKPVKSVEQQRADALAYAKKLYGEDIGVTSPVRVKSSARRASSASVSSASTLTGESNPFAANATASASSVAASKSARKRSAVECDSSDESSGEPIQDVPTAPVAGRKKQASPTPPAAPASSTINVDPVKAARMEAQRLAQERAAASASAAAERANKAKAKKK